MSYLRYSLVKSWDQKYPFVCAHITTYTQFMSLVKPQLKMSILLHNIPYIKHYRIYFSLNSVRGWGGGLCLLTFFIKDCFGSPRTVSSPSPPFLHLSGNSKLNQIFSPNDKVTSGPWWHLCFCFFSFSYTFIGNCSSFIMFNFYASLEIRYLF